jgi:hypothetical protein
MTSARPAGGSAPQGRAATHARSLPPLPRFADRGLSECVEHGGGKSEAGEIDEVAERNMNARCLLHARSGNGPGADAAPARAEGDV